MSASSLGQRRPAAAGVDHQVGPDLLAVVGDDADHVGDAGDGGVAGQQRPARPCRGER